MAVTRKRLSLIRAPFSGILGRIPLKEGSLVDDSDLLTSLSDNRRVMVYFNLSETDYLDYRLHPERYTQSGLQLVLANGEVFGAKGKSWTWADSLMRAQGRLRCGRCLPT